MICKIKTTDLQVGMYIDRIDASWFSHPFLSNKVKIDSSDDIKKLIDSKIEWVYVDYKKSTHYDENQKNFVSFAVEKERASEIYKETKEQVYNLINDVKCGNQINSPQLSHMVTEMAHSILRNDQALVSLTRLKDHNEYIYNHSINVCLLCLAMGNKLEQDDEEMVCLGLGGLLHDIGLTKLPPSLLNSDYTPSEEEIKLLKNHPNESVDILRKTEGIPDDTITMVQNHHERFNGEGYPRKLQGKAIGSSALIIRLADFYDHITSKWYNHEATLPPEAVKMILQRSQSYFSPLYVSMFLECLGMYPIGTLVELNSREIGIVMENNKTDATRPRILLLTDSHCIPLPEKILINLADPDDQMQQKKIIHALNPDSLGIDPEKYLA